MNVHAVTATTAAPIHPDGDGEIDSLFSSHRRSAVENRTKFTLKARLAMLSRLKATMKTREDEIIRALYTDFRKPESEVRLTSRIPSFK